MTGNENSAPLADGSATEGIAADAPESAGELRAYLKLELARAFEKQLASGTKLPEQQRQSLVDLLRKDSVTAEAILSALRRPQGQST